MDYLCRLIFTKIIRNKMAAWKQGNQSRTCWRSLNDQQECEVWFSVQKLKYIKQALWSYMQHSTTWMLSDTVKHCKRFKDLKCAVFIIFVGFSGSLDGGGKKIRSQTVSVFSQLFQNHIHTWWFWASSPSRLYPDWETQYINTFTYTRVCSTEHWKL